MPTPRNPASPPRRPPLIGLTGGIGAGKSTALAAFARHGASVLDSDAVVHELYERADVRDAVAARLGEDVIAADGSVDRAEVARLVFADDELRRWLESLIHPLVGEAFERWVAEELRRVPAPRALVHEVPLLFETGAETRYDRTVAIAASEAVRRRRIAGRGRLDRLAEREARLLSEAERTRRADDVIVNDGDLAELDRRIAVYLDEVAA